MADGQEACPVCDPNDASAWSTPAPACPSTCADSCDAASLANRSSQVSVCTAAGADKCSWSDRIRVTPCPAPAACPEPVDCELAAEPSAWTKCDADGVRIRTRAVIRPASNGGKPCDPSLMVERDDACAPETPCKVTKPFGQWTRCTAPCGGGMQFRSREVVSSVTGLPTAQCEALSVETQACNQDPCSSFDGNPDGAVVTWPMVDAAQQLNVKQPTSPKAVSFGPNQTPPTVGPQLLAYVASGGGSGGTAGGGGGGGVTPQDCQYTQFSDWSECSEPCWSGKVGTQFQTRQVLAPAVGGGVPCDVASLVQTRQCHGGDGASGTCAEATPCKLSDWVDVTACSPSCTEASGSASASAGTPTKTQQRSIQAGPSNGGKPCEDFPLTREVACTAAEAPPCAVRETCLYGPWPSNQADGDTPCKAAFGGADAVPFFFESMPVSLQVAWLATEGVSGVDQVTTFASGGDGGDGSGGSKLLPRDLAGALNSGQLVSTSIGPYELQSGGWVRVPGSKATVPAQQPCPAHLVVSAAPGSQSGSAEVSCKCPSLCPWVPSACAWSACDGGTPLADRAAALVHGPLWGLVRDDDDQQQASLCRRGVKSLTRQPLQAPGSCDPLLLTQQQPCLTATPCSLPCPVGCNGKPCSGNGTCDPSTGECKCSGQFSGVTCSNSCPSDDWGRQCGGRGDCDQATGRCVCHAGFAGPACSQRSWAVVGNLATVLQGIRDFAPGPQLQVEAASGTTKRASGTANTANNSMKLEGTGAAVQWSSAGECGILTAGQDGQPPSLRRGCDACFDGTAAAAAAAAAASVTAGKVTSAGDPSLQQQVWPVTVSAPLGAGDAGTTLVEGFTCADLGFDAGTLQTVVATAKDTTFGGTMGRTVKKHAFLKSSAAVSAAAPKGQQEQQQQSPPLLRAGLQVRSFWDRSRRRGRRWRQGSGPRR